MQANTNHSQLDNIQANKVAEATTLAAKVALLDDLQRHLTIQKVQLNQALSSPTDRKPAPAKEKTISDGTTVEHYQVPMGNCCPAYVDDTNDYVISDNFDNSQSESISFDPIANSSCVDGSCTPMTLNSYSPEPMQYYGIETIVNDLKLQELTSTPGYGEYRLQLAQLANVEMAERMIANQAESARLALSAFTSSMKDDKNSDSKDNQFQNIINNTSGWQLSSDKRHQIT